MSTNSFINIWKIYVPFHIKNKYVLNLVLNRYFMHASFFVFVDVFEESTLIYRKIQFFTKKIVSVILTAKIFLWSPYIFSIFIANAIALFDVNFTLFS